MIKAIGHVAFGVTDLKKSVDFYCGILGFQELFSIIDEVGTVKGMYIKVTHEQYLELFKTDACTSSSTQSYRHLCLHTADIRAVIEHIRKHGYNIDRDIRTGKDGNLQAWVMDPDGNKIEFMQLMPNSKQKTYDPD